MSSLGTQRSPIHRQILGAMLVATCLASAAWASDGVKVASETLEVDRGWSATFDEPVNLRASGEYRLKNQVDFNLESFSALSLEPSSTSAFQTTEMRHGPQLTFQDAKSALVENPNFDATQPVTSSNFPFNRAMGAIAAFGWVDQDFQNVRVEGIVNGDLGLAGSASQLSKSRQGLMARWDKSNNFYWFYVNYATGGYGLMRSRFFGEMTPLYMSMGLLPGFRQDKAYRLKFSLVGGEMMGEIYEISPRAEDRLIAATPWVTDPEPHLAGVSGVLVEVAIEAATEPLTAGFSAVVNTPLGGSTDTIEVPEVPEFVVDRAEARLHFALAERAMRRHDYAGAVESYAAAIEVDPNYVEALDSVAWILATSQDPSVRDAARAIGYADRVMNLVHFGQFRRPDSGSSVRAYWPVEMKIRTLNTLAASYAAAGIFEPPGFGEQLETAEDVLEQTEAGSHSVAAKTYALMAVEVAQNLYDSEPSDKSKELLDRSKAHFDTYEGGKALFISDPSTR